MIQTFVRGAFALALVGAVGLLAQSSIAAHHEEPEAAATPLVVKVHADWCGTCVKLNPVMTELEQQLGDQARVVILDVTDKERIEASRATAAALGIEAFFDAHKGKTGTVAVMTADGETVDVFKGETDVAVYVAAVAKAKGTSSS